MDSAARLSAVADFRRARNRADLQRLVARVTGKPSDLLSYDEVRRKLRASGQTRRGRQQIPLDAIVGSAGRYQDFTRSFLPRLDSDEDRWARVHAAMIGMGGLPPIEVYQIGQVYFVVDGNHRVSVARQLGAPTIEAYVTELDARVPLTPDAGHEELIIRAEQVEFLEKTGLDELRPGADLTVTTSGRYQALLEHIDVHRYFSGLEKRREIPYPEAVAHWYDAVYRPAVKIVRRRGLLRDFPGRTETDLYLWLAEHRAALEEELGWEVSPVAAADDLVEQESGGPGRVLARVGERVLDALVPDALEAGPAPGVWRRGDIECHEESLFPDILVPVGRDEGAWVALEQALLIARREESYLHGLHVARNKAKFKTQAPSAIQERFERRCQQEGIPGRLTLRTGKVARQICASARWAHLVVVRLNHPPAPDRLARLGSGFRELVRRCPRPILTVRSELSTMDRALLAFDGSPKAREALYIAAYLACAWGTGLVVLAVAEPGRPAEPVLDQAGEYLQRRDVDAKLVQESGPVAETILRIADREVADLLIMGGYGLQPLAEVVLGSAVDQVLRQSFRPVLICR